MSGSVPVLLSLAGDPYIANHLLVFQLTSAPLQFIFDSDLLHCNYLELGDVGQGMKISLDISVQQQKYLEKMSYEKIKIILIKQIHKYRIDAAILS